MVRCSSFDRCPKIIHTEVDGSHHRNIYRYHKQTSPLELIHDDIADLFIKMIFNYENNVARDDRLVSDFNLGGLIYYRGWNGNRFEELGASLIVGNSLLTARHTSLW